MRSAYLLLALVLGCPQPATSRPETPPGSPLPAPAPQPDAVPRPEPAPVPEPELPTAGGLHYLEIVLGDAKPEDALPMIVAIHGLGDHPDNFAHLFDTFSEPARLVLPQGVDPTDEGGWSWFPLRARDPDVEALAQGIATASDKLATHIAALRERRPTVGAPIVTGFSQGGMLVFALAVRHPEVVGTALPVGGWLPPPLVPTQRGEGRSPPIDAYHGTDDRAVGYEPTKTSVEALRTLGIAATLHTYEGVGHVITPEIHRDLTDRIVDAVHDAARSEP